MDEMIFYKKEANTIYIRATGHITANSCSQLKDRVFEDFDSDNSPQSILIDLSQCEYMDSTFMGLIAGFNKRLLRSGKGPLTLFKVTATCQKLLKTMGIANLVTLSDDLPQFPAMMEPMNTSENATPEFILDSHNNLIELSEENEKRFATLRTILQNTINEQDKDDKK
ncbi:MAG TPA: STAS domain-containing protein [Spirochaetia bacterium]|nr:STAS domain-containing protein [Spirochaetales bacterium]HRS66438.1 STAS domain-containing protein [Spirochaetia bacterium]HOT58626.1 STAS domain-containing protein [Spirochaetales bacterium]HPD80130.1 STAS domain-containing protein [Spirochaetales bacterium]HQG40509.1 STAS domain-containing protein [Spirochaetales bacterium]